MDERIFRSLKDNWAAGGLRRTDTRKALLKKLRGRIKAHEDDIIAAERADFNKCAFDVYATEISLVYGEIDCAIRHLSSWARPRRTRVSLPNFPARCTVTPEAYGVVLVIAPWNYPFQLALAPLVGAVAAGNCDRPRDRDDFARDVCRKRGVLRDGRTRCGQCARFPVRYDILYRRRGDGA